MFKAKEFKELIGFNHTKLVIASVIVTGISFPFIFLGDDINEISRQGVNHALIGWAYAGVLHFVNLLIFYKFKKKDKKEGTVSTIKLFFRRNYPLHLIVTVVITALMSLGPYQAMGFACTEVVLIKNILGTTILMSVIVGFYETAFYMKALGKVIKEREQLKTENIEAQLELLKSQVQPHFLFNSLNTLASIIPAEPEHAIQYVQNLSKVYRYILEIKDKKLISVKDELGCILAYLFMLETRFGAKLRCNIDLDSIDHNQFIVPLSLQMLIENAVKHNTVSAKRPLTIHIRKKDDFIEVKNNLQLKEEDCHSTKTGLENIAKRFELVANKSVRIEKSADHFAVYLPLIHVLND